MKRFNLAVLIALAMGVMPLASAQTASQIDDQFDGDAPEHGVARMGVVQGDVSVQRGDSGEIVAAELNTPLVTLDHVITGPDGRTELQLDYANFTRVGPLSEVRLGQLRDNNYLLQIAEGTITYRILRESQAVVEISTPSVSVHPTQQGTYRVTVHSDGSTEITVRRGLAEIYKQQGMEILAEGRTMEVRGDPTNPQTYITSVPPIDDWDRWNQSRDRDLEQSSSYKYVSRDIDGAEDLDASGRWLYDAPYGNVWVPTVSADWAPYRDGRWVDVDYYGWTWLSSDPWGWAPYHYGSWYSSPYGWAWYPGAIGARYHWRPAMVAFFGWGGGVNVGFGYGNVGWVPLAPYERYRPWYGGSGGGSRVTVINNVNITNVYRNATNVKNVTSVRAADFGRRNVNRGSFLRASNNDLRNVGRVNGQIGIPPSAESRRFTDRPVSASTASRGNSRFTNQNSRFGSNPTNGGGFNGSKNGAGGGNNTGNGARGGGRNGGQGTPPSRVDNNPGVGAGGGNSGGPSNGATNNGGQTRGGGRNGGFQNGGANNPGAGNNAGQNPAQNNIPNQNNGRGERGGRNANPGNSTGGVVDNNGNTVNPRRGPSEIPSSTPANGNIQSRGESNRGPRVQPQPQNVPQNVQRAQPGPIEAPRVDRRSAPAPAPNVQRAPAPAPAPPPMRSSPPPAPAPAPSAPAAPSNGGRGGEGVRKR